MITGIVAPNHDPIIRLLIRGSGGILHEIEAVIDTGFTGDVCLEQSLINALGLRYDSQERTMLADDTIIECAVYAAVVLWDGEEKNVLVQASSGSPLIGMELMEGYELRIEVCDGGIIHLNLLP